MALAATPLGGGRWKKVNPSLKPQQCAGGQIKGDVFHLPPKANGQTIGSGCHNGHLRAEYGSKDHYTSGVHQFTGKFTINSFGGDRISLKQTIGYKGAWFMLAADHSGDLYGVGGRGTIAKGVAKVGATVTVNTIHDADTGLYKVFINGEEKYSTTSPREVWGDKYGAYATVSGSGPITVTWNDVEFYTR
ncbi:hypothetical protein J7337_010813 [Fusarium musae]|uniref:Lectin n=1 Tax=Fusarium musae TaxID=1042133 RepID=A0A9P8D9Z5_9HYPO|nr:hypothetical protein J7337_010813 [Fusarium musae]KAG9497937.1 hypothetical protein J7337_010813 [Fusarium musae]